MTDTDFPQTDPPDEPGSMTEDQEPRRRSASSRREGGERARTGGAASDEPKPRSPRSPAGSGRPTAGPARDLRGRLEELFSAMALIPMTAGDAYSASIITSRAGHLAEAWADLAKQNPAVRRVLEGLLQGGAWGGVVLATGSIIVPILGHYGVLPPIDPWAPIYGTPPIPQGRFPIVTPAPSNVPPNPRANGAGTPSTNGDPGAPMTPPLAPDQPPGVVTVAGSGSRATQVPGA